jgi:imidazolonepropionase-like amidohydrolase
MTRRKITTAQRSPEPPIRPQELELVPDEHPGSHSNDIHSDTGEDLLQPNQHNSLSDSDSDSKPSLKVTHLIHANLLIPGRGPPTLDSNVVIQDGKIIFVGPSRSLPDEYRNLLPTYVPVLMPGMWDCHTHLIGATSFNFDSVVTLHPATAGARLARSCADILDSGFTSVRELGGWALEIAPAIEEGTIPGPHIYSAGAALSQTAGHGDVFNFPLAWTWGASRGDGVSPLCLADGVSEVRKAVRLQIRRGAQVIKVLASGGVLSIADDPLLQQFSDEELTVIVDEAGRMGRIVAAHVHGKAGILAAIRAGCRTLEHGTYLDEECVEKMKERDVMLVATRTIVKEGVKHPELMSKESYVKMLETAKHHLQAYKLAIKSGVKIALGTDLGSSIPGQALSLGKSGAELSYAVEAGMTALEAIEAATANGPLTLGGMAPKSGQIKEGFDADLIAVARNPLLDVKILAEAKNITHVWKSGKLCKAPRREVFE